MIFCGAATITWALVVADVPSTTHVLQPQAFECFTQLAHCQMAERAANNAFVLSGFGATRRATCTEQPISRINWFAPFGWNGSRPYVDSLAVPLNCLDSRCIWVKGHDGCPLQFRVPEDGSDAKAVKPDVPGCR